MPDQKYERGAKKRAVTTTTTRRAHVFLSARFCFDAHARGHLKTLPIRKARHFMNYCNVLAAAAAAAIKNALLPI